MSGTNAEPYEDRLPTVTEFGDLFDSVGWPRYGASSNAAALEGSLFDTVALADGEVVAMGPVGQAASTEFYVAGTAMLVMVLAMWWSYFDWLLPIGEHSLKQASGTALGRLARDAYTVGHYPLVAGVILFAVGTEELLLHPEAALESGARSSAGSPPISEHRRSWPSASPERWLGSASRS